MRRGEVEEALQVLGERLSAIGGAVEKGTLHAPATSDELDLVELRLEQPIPDSLRLFFSEVAAGVSFGWTLDRSASVREVGIGIPEWGAVDLHLDQLVAHEQCRAGWVAQCFPDPENEYDIVWHDKFAFHHVLNGDLLAIDPDGQVIYLSHDDGEGHGQVMGRSFEDFFSAWMRLGFPGPEDWEWMRYLGRHGLDPEGPSARDWRRCLEREP